MNVTDLKTRMHMQEWTKLIKARQDSGLSIKAWYPKHMDDDSLLKVNWRRCYQSDTAGLPFLFSTRIPIMFN